MKIQAELRTEIADCANQRFQHFADVGMSLKNARETLFYGDANVQIRAEILQKAQCRSTQDAIPQ